MLLCFIASTKELDITPNEIFLNIEFDETEYRGKVAIEKQEQLLITALKSVGIDTDNNLTLRGYDSVYHRKKLARMKSLKLKSMSLWYVMMKS